MDDKTNIVDQEVLTVIRENYTEIFPAEKKSGRFNPEKTAGGC